MGQTEALVGLSVVIFVIGLLGVVTRKNILFLLMSVELMLNSANLLFVAAAKQHNQLDGHVMVLFIITVAACEAAVGLAMVIALFRRYGTLRTDFLRILRG